jgi:hypothetical protein
MMNYNRSWWDMKLLRLSPTILILIPSLSIRSMWTRQYNIWRWHVKLLCIKSQMMLTTNNSMVSNMLAQDSPLLLSVSKSSKNYWRINNCLKNTGTRECCLSYATKRLVWFNDTKYCIWWEILMMKNVSLFCAKFSLSSTLRLNQRSLNMKFASR